MKNGLVFLVVGTLAGCVQAPVPAFNAERVPDGKADALAGHNWGKVEYARKQYAGFAYDSTGLYGNLHGQVPELLKLTLQVSKQGKGFIRDLHLNTGLLAHLPADANTDVGVPPVRLKWLGQPLISPRTDVYGRTFWIPWSAFELDGPPADGQVRVSVHAMRREGKGATFLIPGAAAP